MRLLSRVALAAALCFVTVPALAAGTPSLTQNAAPEDPNWAAAKAAIAQKKYEEAAPLLQQVVAKDAKNADAWNYLGYVSARAGRDEDALSFYGRALAIEPRHRGANEYLGELHLKLGDVAKAEERLKVLDGACLFGCAEYDLLKKAVNAYKQTGKYMPQKG